MRKEKIGNETKRNKAKIRYTNFALVRSEKFKEKRRGTILFFHVSVRNACETDLVSLHFTLKRKKFFCETGTP